jgi:predicted nucleic acid-binding protein
MGKSTEAYVDTAAFIAFLDKSDTYHTLYRRLFSAPPRLVTTPLVIAEGHAWFLRRYDRTRAFQFLAFIEDLSVLNVISVGTKEQSGAIVLMRKFADQDLTVVDAVGLFLMKQRKINICWSTDFHLGLTGAKLAHR